MSGLISYIGKIFSRSEKKEILNQRQIRSRTSPSFRWTANSSLNYLSNQIDLQAFRKRAHNLVNTNAYAESAVSKIASNVIGTGIISEFKGEFEQEIWDKWSNSTACDADGVLTHYAQQKLIMRELVISGEVFVRKMNFGYDPVKRNIPLKLRIYGAEYLDSSKNDVNYGDNYIVEGIEIDRLGNRVAFWMFPFNPESNMGIQQESVRVPAEEVIHIFDKKRPQQMRGRSWLDPVASDLEVSDNYQRAELKRKEQNSSICGFMTDNDETQEDDEDTIYEKIRPGTILKLPPGKNITFTTTQSDSHYDQYNASVLRKIAVGLNISYEVLTGDLSKVSFASSRLGFLEFQRQIESWRWNIIIPMFCERVAKWFLESAEIAGYDVSKVTHMDYTAPHREMIDPAKETSALVTSIRAGLKTHKEALKELGYNPQKFYDEIAEVNKILDEKKIILDSDPRYTTQQGLSQHIMANLEDDEEKK